MLPDKPKKPRLPGVTPYVVSSPLWSRAPARDAEGKPYSDFIMLIPGLKKLNEAGKESCLVKVRTSLQPFEHVVVYVDVNIKLSCVWISHKPVPGITRDLVLAIQHELPEAKVVACDFNPEDNKQNQSALGWFSSFRHKITGSLKLLNKN